MFYMLELLQQPHSPLLQEDAAVSGAPGAPHGPRGDHREWVGPGARWLPASHHRGAVRGQPQRGHPAAGLPHHRGDEAVRLAPEVVNDARSDGMPCLLQVECQQEAGDERQLSLTLQQQTVASDTEVSPSEEFGVPEEPHLFCWQMLLVFEEMVQ